jgi:hypothetical protein
MADVSKIVPKQLDPEKQYVVRVRSVNPLGTKSEWSNGLYIDTSRSTSAAGLFTQTNKEFSIINDDGELVFGAYSNKETRINLIKNPSFEVNTTGWAALSNSTIARSTAKSFHGASSVAITPNPSPTSNTAIGVNLSSSDYATVTPGTKYSVSLYVYREYSYLNHAGVDQQTSKVRLKVNLYNGSNVLKASVQASEPTNIPNNKWTRVHLESVSIPTGVSKLGLTLQLDDSVGESIISASEKIFVDAVLVEASQSIDTYFDGSTAGSLTSWSGTAHASTSTFNNTAAGSIFTRGSLNIGGILRSNNYVPGILPSPYSVSGTEIDLSVGSLVSPSLSWDAAGNIKLKGDITGGSIHINDYFHVDNLGNMWLGSTAGNYAGAAFQVSNLGAVRANQFVLADMGTPRITWATNVDDGAFGLWDGFSFDAADAFVQMGLYALTDGLGNEVVLRAYDSDFVGRTSSFSASQLNASIYCGNNSDFQFSRLDVKHSHIHMATKFLYVGADEELRIGDWVPDVERQGIIGDRGYLLLSSWNAAKRHVYLRTLTDTDNLYLGVDGANKLTIQGSDGNVIVTNALAIGTVAAGTGDTLVWGGLGAVQRIVSNRRFKDQITDLPQALSGELIDKLQPVSFIYRWMKQEEEEPEDCRRWREAHKTYGLIAEDVYDVDPFLSKVDIEAMPTNWDERAVVTLLVAEVKNLRKRIAAIEKKNK